MKVDKTLAASAALHALVIGWGLVSFASKPFESHPEESLPVEIVSVDQLAKVAAGMKSGKKETTKPLVEKVAEAKAVDDTVGKISEKPPVETETSPPPAPKVEKPVEKKPEPPKPVVEKKPDPPKPVESKPTPEPPKPVAEAKPEPKPEKPAEKKPDPPKVDPIAEALKKEPPKPKPKPRPATPAAATPPPAAQQAKPKDAPVFDQSKIAALLNKQDPTRRAATGESMNATPALGLAHGRAADNSATWGAMFKSQVERCWKKPYGGIEAQRAEVEFSVKLKRDGSLEVTPQVTTAPNTPYVRVYGESALRAIIECQPYNLPAAFFEEWKYFLPVFTERDRA